MPKQSNQITEKERDVIIARLEVLSSELHFSSGDGPKSISRDEMIQHVKAGDEIGNEYSKIELEFIRAAKAGELFKGM